MKQYEAEAGLDLSSKIIVASQILPGLPEPVNGDDVFPKLLEKALKATSAVHTQPDLYYFRSILTSIGLNKNYDYFDVVETWAARHTPEDKQINYEHNEKDIIGHMVGCYAVNQDLSQILPDSLSVDQLPEKYHIISAGVLYQRWEDSELQGRMQEIIEQISKGELFVSMECLFNDFDYILIDEATAKSEIVTRNHQTAFLTKYLPGFGGTGVYNSRKVGRVLKNIIFSGKGIVKKPANPESIILTNANETKSGDNKIMATENLMTNNPVAQIALPEVEKLRVEVQALTASLEEAKKEKEAAKANAVKEAQAKSEKEFNDIKASLATKDEEIKSLTEKLAQADESIKSAQTELEATKASAKAAQDELATIAAAQKTALRVAKLKNYGKTEEEAIALEQSLVSLDDAAFDVVAAMCETKHDKKEDKKEEKKVYSAEDQDNEAGADKNILNALAAQKSVAGIVKSSESEATLMEQFQKSIAKDLKLCQKFKKSE